MTERERELERCLRRMMTESRIKSVDKDNFEFTITVTCYVLDEARALLSRTTEEDGK